METEKSRTSSGWLTCDELAFLHALGTHNEASVKVPRVVWLQEIW